MFAGDQTCISVNKSRTVFAPEAVHALENVAATV
jgi:hypothetical protein